MFETAAKNNKIITSIADKQNGNGPFFAPVMQTKLRVNEPGDIYEQEADGMAEKVMRMKDVSLNETIFFSAAPIAQRKCAACEEEEKEMHRKESHTEPIKVPAQTENYINSLQGGKEMGNEERNFFESRMGYDFSDVKIQNDSQANESAKNVNALAYTHGSNIVFGSGQYQPNTDEGKKLLAHELTHTIQQSGMVQRTVELRPPGRGEASAFDRRQEIVDRLNRLSNAVRYSLNERVLQYELIEGGVQTYFDRQMIGFIDNGAVIPLRLITGKGLVGSRATGFSPLLIDEFWSGYLDLDDLMRSDDTSFQMNLLHILTERSRARNYARRLGSPGLSPVDATGNLTPEFRRAHQAGVDSERDFLRDIFSDPTIRFTSETTSGDNLIFTFRSTEGYRIVHTFNRQSRTVSGGTVVVINAARETVSVADFIRQRREAAEAAAADAL